jgi:hypothetical protein
MTAHDLPPELRDRLRDSHNAMVAALIECYGPDAPIIQEIGGFDYSLSATESNLWYEEFLESEKE